MKQELEREGEVLADGGVADAKVRRVEVPGGAPRAVHIDDVDDVIGIAAELRQRQAELLTVEELEEVARELDIEPQYVQRAVSELAARRARVRVAEAEAARVGAATAARRKRWLAYALAVVACVAVVVLGGAYGAASTMRAELAEVQRTRAQVRTVVERQAAVEARWRDAPDGVERNAELSGAENRVAIERRRYDEAATRYNSAGGGFFAALAASWFELPEQVPLSSDVETW